MRKKNFFGDDHEILFDSVINHDAYAFLRITLEVPRGQDEEAIILLNNKPIGKVQALRQTTPQGIKTVGYVAVHEGAEVDPTAPHHRQLGKAVASVVSSYVQ